MVPNKQNFIHEMSKSLGHPPGTIIPIVSRSSEKVRITIFDFDEQTYQEKEVKTVQDCFPFKDTSTVTWINIDGLSHVDVIEEIGKYFEIHPIVLEDIANTGQRPKFEDMEKYIFVIAKMLQYDSQKDEIEAEQLSLILGPNFVISFQESEGDIFNNIRDRIRFNKGRVRKMASDYLAYTLIDTMVDHYFVILEKIDDTVEELEEVLLKNPSAQTLQSIHELKREIIFLRKSIWPLREVVSAMLRSESHLIKKNTRIFLSDVYDHTIQVIDTIESFRDMTSGILDIYLSNISYKMNEVMKIMTIFTAIFIPLNFIVGIYGMNFKYMPELEWKWGYHAVLTVLFIVGSALLLFFKRMKWIN